MDAPTIALVLVPLIILELSLMGYALYDLFQEDRRVRGDKIIWALVIVFVNVIGPLIYLFVGRDESRGTETGGVGSAPSASIAAILATWPALSATQDASVTITNLTKRYGAGIVALDHLNLAVPSGSIFGFLGPNGAGKTTTLRLLTGLATATDGTATVAGVRTGGTDGRLARNIGYLDQDPRFYGWMRGRELLDMVAQLHGLHGAALRQRVGEVLEIVGLQDAANRRIGGYSGGMRQRLGIGQALINQPRVLFLDEPVSSLDPEGRRDVLEIVSRLRGTATVFMSTHILNDVERVCDRVAILHLGRLVVEGPIDELLDRYAQPIYELVPEPQQPGAIERLAVVMRGQPWTHEVRTTPDTVRVFVNDPKVAGPAILPLVVSSGVGLVRYERARPSLEDVFLRLVAESGLSIAPPVEIPVTGLDGRGRR
ncbi:MAG TPA: ATP-binding cassette domain-containing protein [Candidatus Limnocylindrales bacterium]|jgi:ABC-type multidrug transport system, ATPase component|nr:ATP-binding cassette domain-containing protein [Candidatus Limnocylindrales bacterium]